MTRPNLYDYLKVFAIITMIIDHIGYFLYPEIMWLRVIGRLAFPIFFFLIGRNGSSRISYELIFLACFIQWILRWASIFMWYHLRQLNILPVAILVKLLLWCISQSEVLILRYCEEAGINTIPTKQSIKFTYFLLFLLILFVVLTTYAKWIMEYGFMWFAMAIFWYMTKNKKIIWSRWVYSAALLSLIGCIFVNNAFPFSYTQRITVVCWWSVIWYILYSYNLYSYSTWTELNLPTHTVRGFQRSVGMVALWLSNYAVWIYVLHFSILLWIVIIRR